MIEVAILKNIAVAIALGALIGLEREYSSYKKRAHDYAGIRTFPLIALFGALSALLGRVISPWILIVGMAVTALLIVLAYFSTARHSTANFGATSEMAGFLTFFIGVLALYGELSFAAILTVIITVILYARSLLHQFAARIKEKEIADTLKFAIIIFVVLPFLPNKWYGPLGGLFNPYVLWLMVIFISGISFAGYVLMKWLGEKGLTLAGILGGVVSSTATTTSFAQRSKKETSFFRALALGVILANSVMFVRILIEVFVINRELFMELLLPLAVLTLISVVFSYFLWHKAKETKGKIELKSPFTLFPALKFGVFFAVIIALAKIADAYLASRGIYLVSFISGFADVDAITVSLSQLAKGDLSSEIARNGIIIAAMTNVAVKGGIAYWLGGKKFSGIVLSLFVVLIVVGIGMLFLV